MTLHARDEREWPEDIRAVGDQLLAPDDPYRTIGEQLADIVRDSEFADLYRNHGRAAVSPAVLALVTLFQFAEDIPDREAARQLRVRLDWKYALRLGLTDPGFHYSDLSYFRRRLREHAAERRVFEAILTRVRRLGLLRARKQRTDALAVLGAVAELSTLELVWETVRLAVGAGAEQAPLWAQAKLPTSWREPHERRRSDYRLSPAQRAEALRVAGQDAAWLLEQLAGAPAAVRELEAVATLGAVWEQRFERGEDGAIRPRAGEVSALERVVTPHDPDVRVGQKRGKVWRGEKVHVTETAEPARPGAPTFITDVRTVGASTGDGEALPAIRAELAARGRLPAEQDVDAGYVSGKTLAESAAAGVELVGPPLADNSPQPLKLADFAVDWEARRAICPAGHTSVKSRLARDRDGTLALHLAFAPATCRACPLRPACTTGQGGRTLHVNEHHALVAARRAAARTEAFRRRLHARAAIESTLSELVRGYGFRRHRYRGAAQRAGENLLKAASCNLFRLTRALRPAPPTRPAAPARPRALRPALRPGAIRPAACPLDRRAA
jgi:transposase